MAAKKSDKPTIIIRREEVVEGGHHGGAWKVAYADFVTAMMAFFLLMWLLNATTEEQRKGLADYFSPNNVLARTASGFGAPFGGHTPNIDGSLASDRGAVQVVFAPPHPNVDTDEDEGDVPAQSAPSKAAGSALIPTARDGGTAAALRATPSPDTDPLADPVPADLPDLTGKADSKLQADIPRPGAKSPATAEREQLERAAQQIQDAVRNDPVLAPIAKQLQVDLTPEGLRIQIVDEDKQPMFASGSATLNDRARALLAKVAPVLLRLPEGISIAGHTDAQPYRGGDRSNWDLSADRANATRRLLTDAGLPEARIHAVAGHADREPLLPGDPLAAANRRIAILVLRDRPAR